MQRLRLRYAKRGRLRFTSHRDFARAFERALRRAQVPMAYSAGFTPHPRISYSSAAPTGAASEAEYLEIGLTREVDPEALRTALDAALPPGLDVLEAVPAGGDPLADRLQASRWRVELSGVEVRALAAAVDAFLARTELPVVKRTKSGARPVDVRSAVVSAEVPGDAAGAAGSGAVRGPTGGPERTPDPPCAILVLVVRHVTPAVRPEDIVTGLRSVADLDPPVPPRSTRLAQGALTAEGRIADPLAADRAGLSTERRPDRGAATDSGDLPVT